MASSGFIAVTAWITSDSIRTINRARDKNPSFFSYRFKSSQTIQSVAVSTAVVEYLRIDRKECGEEAFAITRGTAEHFSYLCLSPATVTSS